MSTNTFSASKFIPVEGDSDNDSSGTDLEVQNAPFEKYKGLPNTKLNNDVLSTPKTSPNSLSSASSNSPAWSINESQRQIHNEHENLKEIEADLLRYAPDSNGYSSTPQMIQHQRALNRKTSLIADKPWSNLDMDLDADFEVSQLQNNRNNTLLNYLTNSPKDDPPDDMISYPVVKSLNSDSEVQDGLSNSDKQPLTNPIKAIENSNDLQQQLQTKRLQSLNDGAVRVTRSIKRASESVENIDQVSNISNDQQKKRKMKINEAVHEVIDLTSDVSDNDTDDVEVLNKLQPSNAVEPPSSGLKSSVNSLPDLPQHRNIAVKQQEQAQQQQPVVAPPDELDQASDDDDEIMITGSAIINKPAPSFAQQMLTHQLQNQQDRQLQSLQPLQQSGDINPSTQFPSFGQPKTSDYTRIQTTSEIRVSDPDNQLPSWICHPSDRMYLPPLPAFPHPLPSMPQLKYQPSPESLQKFKTIEDLIQLQDRNTRDIQKSIQSLIERRASLNRFMSDYIGKQSNSETEKNQVYLQDFNRKIAILKMREIENKRNSHKLKTKLWVKHYSLVHNRHGSSLQNELDSTVIQKYLVRHNTVRIYFDKLKVTSKYSDIMRNEERDFKRLKEYLANHNNQMPLDPPRYGFGYGTDVLYPSIGQSDSDDDENKNMNPPVHVLDDEDDSDEDPDDRAALELYRLYSGNNNNTNFSGGYSLYNNPYANQIYRGAINSKSEEDTLKDLLDNIKPDEAYEDGIESTPDDLRINLLKHQRIGLKWMLSMESSKNKGGILADDMGLGKTVQAISVIVANKSTDSKCKTNLVVAPVSLLRQWCQEIEDKVKSDKRLTAYMFHQKNKAKTFSELKKYDIVLVSYQTLTSEMKKHFALSLSEMKGKKAGNGLPDGGGESYQSPFFTSNAKFYRVILDEAQSIKNKLALCSKAVAKLNSTYRWCLSGTPMQNNIDELYPLLRFLDIGPYNDEQKFKNAISNPMKSQYGRSEKAGIRKVQALLTAILLRRTKTTEIDGKPILELPEKHIKIEHVIMSEDEKEYYKSLEANAAKKAERMLNAGKEKNKKSRGAFSSILTMLLRLRQACDHQYLVEIGENAEYTAKIKNLKGAFTKAAKFDTATIESINDQWTEGFSCQYCKDMIETDENVLLLSGCGHAVCGDCVTEFFDEFSESDWDNERSARCQVCNKNALEGESINLKLFDSICNRQIGYKECQKTFGLSNKALTKQERFDKIQELIQGNNGQLLMTAKIEKCLSLVQEIKENYPNEKIIIFSQFTLMFDILQIVLTSSKLDYLRYDGSMDLELKNETIKQFYQDPSKGVMLLSLKAGNVGLTLTCASHVIILEPFWNPYVEKQAQDRVHRISQTREVYIHRILIKGTVEDRIMDLQKQKEDLVESALDPNGRKSVNRLSRAELGYLFGLNGLAGLENHRDAD